VLFLVVVLSAGIGMGIIHSYLLVYLDDIGAPGIIMGLSLTAATLSELVMFLAAERLIARWGPARLLLFTLALSGVRLLLYSVILAPWGALLVQLLHGPTFSLMYVCGVTTANRLAPEGMEATSQGLFTAVNFGLGGVIGAVLGGLLYDWLTIFGMFRVAGAALILVPVAFAIHAQVHGELPFGASQERE
jgi:MFS family permease